MPTVGSLFSGIGGIDLAFSIAGFDIAWQIEIDSYCRKVLKKNDQYWPHANQFTDVRDCGQRNLERVDVVVGGFPCQDISIAGGGAGLDGARSGLWWDFARIIGELRPRAVFLENVSAITFRGGLQVVGSLTAMGYDAQWGIIRASDTGAPHERKRWYCVAYAGSKRREKHRTAEWFYTPLAHAELPGRKSTRRQIKPRLVRNTHGVSRRLDGHRLMHHLWPARPGEKQYRYEPPRITDRTDNRVGRIRALGNAVVPQTVYPIAVALYQKLS